MTTEFNKNAIQTEMLALLIDKMAGIPNPIDSSIDPETDLYATGLDSLTLMAIVAYWRSQGYQIDFASFSKHPSISAWITLLQTADKTDSSTNAQVSASWQRLQTEQPFALAPMQQAYWLGRNSEQPLGGVSAHLYTEFQTSNPHSSIQPERLEKALITLIQRHSSLRLIVTPEGQQIHKLNAQPAKTLTLNDLTKATEPATEKALTDYRNTFSSNMLDVEAGNVMAIALTQLPDGNSRLHLDVDMMAADAVSYRTLLRELALLYEDPTLTLPPLPMSYRDCRQTIEKGEKDTQNRSAQWWENRLNTLPEGPKLPVKFDLSRKPTSPAQTTRRHVQFDASLRDKLYQQCRQHSLTPAAVLATVLAETLAGWSSNAHFIINVPLFLRPMNGPDISGIVGDFSSSIMLEVDMAQAEPFIERAKKIQSRLHEDAAHADYNGVQVLRDLGRLKGRQVTAPIVYTSALNLGELFEPVVRRVFGDPIWIISQGPQVLLDTQITELDGGLLLNWDCREEAFIDGVLDAMFDFFHSSVLVLANETTSWQQCLADQLPAKRIKGLTPDLDENTTQIAAGPTNVIEHTVARIWSETIGTNTNNIHLNLFAAGGDSVLATSLVARLREIFGVEALDMKTLFAAPSIAGIATTLISACGFDYINEVATLYNEIMALDDESLKAQLAGETS